MKMRRVRWKWTLNVVFRLSQQTSTRCFRQLTLKHLRWEACVWRSLSSDSIVSVFAYCRRAYRANVRCAFSIGGHFEISTRSSSGRTERPRTAKFSGLVAVGNPTPHAPYWATPASGFAALGHYFFCKLNFLRNSYRYRCRFSPLCPFGASIQYTWRLGAGASFGGSVPQPKITFLDHNIFCNQSSSQFAHYKRESPPSCDGLPLLTFSYGRKYGCSNFGGVALWRSDVLVAI